MYVEKTNEMSRQNVININRYSPWITKNCHNSLNKDIFQRWREEISWRMKKKKGQRKTRAFEWLLHAQIMRCGCNGDSGHNHHASYDDDMLLLFHECLLECLSVMFWSWERDNCTSPLVSKLVPITWFNWIFKVTTQSFSLVLLFDST